MRNYQKSALVEHAVACTGKGQYIALVYYGSPSGQLYHKVFKYSHKDPRVKDEAAVLRDVSQKIPVRYRPFIVAISIVKRCLHPKSDQVARLDRQPHFERLFSWVFQHGNTVTQPLRQARREHFEALLEGHRVQPVMLPYTEEELASLPVERMLTTTYGSRMHVTVGLRGVERLVSPQPALQA